MKKPYSFTEMSNLKCECGKAIKQNIVQRKKNPPIRCYKCHIENESLNGHVMMGKKGLAPGPTFKRQVLN